MKQAFLQERNALRFHWVKDLESKQVETVRFTRVLFGLAPSPFLLGGVVQQHLDSCRAEHPEVVAEIQRRLYVDDLITGGSTVQEAQQIKSSAVKFFNKA